MMRKLVFLFFLFPCLLNAQGFDVENVELANFVKRMHANTPFEGVKVINDYDNYYLLSVVSVSESVDNITANRLASVKAMSNASKYFNGSIISSDLIITTNANDSINISTEVIEKISEKSIGYVKKLQFLTSFSNKSGKNIFVYYKKMDLSEK